MATYNSGPRLFAHRCITKGDIMDLCEFLENDIASFEPEPIGGGGILYNFKVDIKTDIPCPVMNHSKVGCGDNKPYKSIRLNIGSIKWPYLQGDYINEWKENDDVILHRGDRADIFLKSFCGAPPFTRAEIEMIVEGFRTIGLLKRRVRI